MNKKDREIINRFLNGVQILYRKEKYEAGIYIKDIENEVAFNRVIEENQEVQTEDKKNNNNLQQNQQQKEVKKTRKNQILLAADEIKKLENKIE